MKTKMNLPVICISCNKEFELSVYSEDMTAWLAGSFIQEAMPYLSAGKRELLVSGTCEECFMRLFLYDMNRWD